MGKLKGCISCIITLGIVIITLGCLSNLFERKGSMVKYADFFSQDEDFDVLFLGSSHMIDGVSPMDMWNDYGIMSYNLGNHSNTLPTSYWTLMNALDYTKPAIVVVDGYLISSDCKISGDNYSSVHNSLDAFPLSLTKIRGVIDLLDDPNVAAGVERGEIIVDEARTPLGLLWNFSVYHGRWNELMEEDFVLEKSYNKGAEDRISIAPMELPQIESVENVDSVGVTYLDKIIEECRERNIGILLVYLPARNGYQAQANWMGEYADEHDVNFINFMNNDCIDPTIDFSDRAGHLNPSGAKKVSRYIGAYLVENYSLGNRKHKGDCVMWQQDFEEYIQYKISLLKSQRSMAYYLMLLNDSSFETNIEADEEFVQQYNRLIDNISCLGKCNVTTYKRDEAAHGADAYIEVKYNGQIVDYVEVKDDTINRN